MLSEIRRRTKKPLKRLTEARGGAGNWNLSIERKKGHTTGGASGPLIGTRNENNSGLTSLPHRGLPLGGSIKKVGTKQACSPQCQAPNLGGGEKIYESWFKGLLSKDGGSKRQGGSPNNIATRNSPGLQTKGRWEVMAAPGKAKGGTGRLKKTPSRNKTETTDGAGAPAGKKV